MHKYLDKSVSKDITVNIIIILQRAGAGRKSFFKAEARLILPKASADKRCRFDINNVAEQHNCSKLFQNIVAAVFI